MVISEVFSTCKTIFKVDDFQVTSIASVDITLIFLLQYLNTLLSYLLEDSEVVARKNSIKNSAKSTGKYLRWGLTCNKAAGCRPATSLNTESGTGAFLWICEIFKNIYFANVYEGLHLNSKIFTAVSYHKILGFYYKRNRQLFYYEGTSSYISLKIPELVNRFIF